MFNNYFYQPLGESVCRDFLTKSGENVAIVIDPPFGGLAGILAQSVKKLWSMADKGIKVVSLV